MGASEREDRFGQNLKYEDESSIPQVKKLISLGDLVAELDELQSELQDSQREEGLLAIQTISASEVVEITLERDEIQQRFYRLRDRTIEALNQVADL